MDNLTHTIREGGNWISTSIRIQPQSHMVLGMSYRTNHPTLERIGEWLKSELEGQPIWKFGDIHPLDIMEWLDFSVMNEEFAIMGGDLVKGIIEKYKESVNG